MIEMKLKSITKWKEVNNTPLTYVPMTKNKLPLCREREFRYACSVPAIMNACTCNPGEGR